MDTPQPLTTCPGCGEAKIRRSRSGTIDRFYALGGYKPYRCRGCDRRFRVVVMEKRSRGTAGGSPERSESRKRRLAAVRREIFIYLFALIAFAVIALAITREAI